MGILTWTTTGGSLGTIEENVFYTLTLVASDSENETVSYAKISGDLPAGLSLRATGVIEGNPIVEDVLQGIPDEVGQNQKSTFVVRASNESGSVIDRTFDITVTGQDRPVITTTETHLGTFIDGQFVSIQISATDPDPNDTLSWSVTNGELPPGLTISSSGLISGYIEPQPANSTAIVGFDSTKFDEFEFDFSTKSISRNYQFSLGVTDGKDTTQAVYTIFVYSANAITADTTDITADSSFITADLTNKRKPVLITTANELTSIVHDNYFAFRFIGRDFDGDLITFEALPALDGDGSTITLPTGLSLDTTTGWLYGTLPYVFATETTFKFGVRVHKTNDPTYKSDITYFSVKLVGDIDSILSWNGTYDAATDTYCLGSLRTGDISTFQVIATTELNRDLTYTFKSGTASSLPQGLKLQSDGLIVGRARFEVFSLDGGTTTFDIENDNYNQTTFDRDFYFTVQVSGNLGQINASARFKISVTSELNVPYEDLYVRVTPAVADRDLYQSLLGNSDVFDPDKLYRPTDSYFGLQGDIQMLIESGLSPEEATTYLQGMATNHFKKTIPFGALKTARALNSDGSILYEVVYISLEDLQAQSGTSTPSSIDVLNRSTIPLTTDNSFVEADTSLHAASATEQFTIYPNSFKNMMDAVKSKVSKISVRTLPLWMRSKQSDGTVPGLINAAVIAYTKPGFSSEIAFRIKDNGFNFRNIHFQTDRYIWGEALSSGYNKTTETFISSEETTFDIDSTQTIFDGDETKFLTGSIGFQERDVGDAFLAFPRENILR